MLLLPSSPVTVLTLAACTKSSEEGTGFGARTRVTVSMKAVIGPCSPRAAGAKLLPLLQAAGRTRAARRLGTHST